MPVAFRMYLAKRLFYVFLTIFFIMSFNFLLFRVMPGDFARILIPKGASDATIEALEDYYGLNEPLVIQYLIYLKQTFTGEFGKSIEFAVGVDVEDILGKYLAKTLFLTGIGTILSIWVGIVLGRETAWRRGKLFDRLGSSFFIIFYCVPTFLFALIMLTVVAKYVPGWPIAREFSDDYFEYGPFGKLWDRTTHLLLPLFALVIETIATFSIIVRSSLIDVLTEEYMVTAVAKGLRGREVLKGHAMPNTMLPVVTVVALNVGWVMSGAIMIEVIFSYQGLGYLTYEAVLAQDYPIIQAAFLLEAVAVIIANFLADLMLFKLDPRVKI